MMHMVEIFHVWSQLGWRIEFVKVVLLRRSSALSEIICLCYISGQMNKMWMLIWGEALVLLKSSNIENESLRRVVKLESKVLIYSELLLLFFPLCLGALSALACFVWLRIEKIVLRNKLIMILATFFGCEVGQLSRSCPQQELVFVSLTSHTKCRLGMDIYGGRPRMD